MVYGTTLGSVVNVMVYSALFVMLAGAVAGLAIVSTRLPTISAAAVPLRSAR